MNYSLCGIKEALPSPRVQPRYVCPEEEIARGPACWLWDYLRCVFQSHKLLREGKKCTLACLLFCVFSVGFGNVGVSCIATFVTRSSPCNC